MDSKFWISSLLVKWFEELWREKQSMGDWGRGDCWIDGKIESLLGSRVDRSKHGGVAWTLYDLML